MPFRQRPSTGAFHSSWYCENLLKRIPEIIRILFSILQSYSHSRFSFFSDIIYYFFSYLLQKDLNITNTVHCAGRFWQVSSELSCLFQCGPMWCKEFKEETSVARLDQPRPNGSVLVFWLSDHLQNWRRLLLIILSIFSGIYRSFFIFCLLSFRIFTSSTKMQN